MLLYVMPPPCWRTISHSYGLPHHRTAAGRGAEQEPPLVERVLKIKKLPEDNARDGTLAPERYEEIKTKLPGYARIAFVIAYHTGARLGEIIAIERDKINLEDKQILLPGRTTKNGKPRYLPIYGDMEPELRAWLRTIWASPCSALIQDEGVRVMKFRRAWARAAGTETLFHDLRRTACTNMIEAGLSEKEAMEISGHKTNYIFKRYHIVSNDRMKQNAEKLEKHLTEKLKEKEAVVRLRGQVSLLGDKVPRL
jgi:integrase